MIKIIISYAVIPGGGFVSGLITSLKSQKVPINIDYFMIKKQVIFIETINAYQASHEAITKE